MTTAHPINYWKVLKVILVVIGTIVFLQTGFYVKFWFSDDDGWKRYKQKHGICDGPECLTPLKGMD